jgi:serine/threonine-protein kinase
MSYCLNPACRQPKNPDNVTVCQSCGSKLLLHNRYRLLSSLGQGGFGATFLAADTSLPGTPCCVIKQLRPANSSPGVLKMAKELFEREARTLGKIGNHPQVPRLLDYFEDKQQFYLVQEYVKGQNLQQEVKKKGPYTETKVRQFLSELLPILRDIHAQKVIHRDIKPANILRREEDQKLVLIDFGIVKNQVDTVAASDREQTALTAFAVGTPGFAPPEQLAMRPVYASDIYALGITCLYLLTAKPAKEFQCDSLTGEIEWDKYVRVTDHFNKVLKKMLEISVRYRYKSAEEVLQALDLEPYLDSLAKGLITPASLPPKPSFSNPALVSNNAAMSDKARLAQAIRDRRARKPLFPTEETPNNKGIDYGKTYIQNKEATNLGTTQSSAQNSNAPLKVDAESIKNYYLKGRRDFTRVVLSPMSLEKANLMGINFREAKLLKVNFQGANLNNADFGGADLRHTSFRNAQLVRAYLSCSNLEGADLRGADLSFTDFKGANLKGVNLCGAKLTNCNISQTQLSQAKTNWSTILPNGKRFFW